MNNMFENIESNFGDKYEITVLSRDPWVVIFDNFLGINKFDDLFSSRTVEICSIRSVYTHA